MAWDCSRQKIEKLKALRKAETAVCAQRGNAMSRQTFSKIHRLSAKINWQMSWTCQHTMSSIDSSCSLASWPAPDGMRPKCSDHRCKSARVSAWNKYADAICQSDFSARWLRCRYGLGRHSDRQKCRAIQRGFRLRPE